MAAQVISILGCMAMNVTMFATRIPDVSETVFAREYTESPLSKAIVTALAAFRSTHINTHPNTNTNTNAIPNANTRPEAIAGAAEHAETQPPIPPRSRNDTIDVEVHVIGVVGDDHHGKRMLEFMAQNGIRTSGVEIATGEQTGVRFGILLPGTTAGRWIITQGATRTLTIPRFSNVLSLGGGRKPGLIVIQTDIQREIVEFVLELAFKGDVDVLLNASPAQVIRWDVYRFITHIVLQRSEAVAMLGLDDEEAACMSWEEIAQELIDNGVQNVVIRLPEGGAQFLSKSGERGEVKIGYREQVDLSIRAGTFTGAYAAEYLNQKSSGIWDMKAAVTRAEQACVLAIQKPDGNGIPWHDEITEFDSGLAIKTTSNPEVNGNVEPAEEN